MLTDRYMVQAKAMLDNARELEERISKLRAQIVEYEHEAKILITRGNGIELGKTVLRCNRGRFLAEKARFLESAPLDLWEIAGRKITDNGVLSANIKFSAHQGGWEIVGTYEGAGND